MRTWKRYGLALTATCCLIASAGESSARRWRPKTTPKRGVLEEHSTPEELSRANLKQLAQGASRHHRRLISLSRKPEVLQQGELRLELVWALYRSRAVADPQSLTRAFIRLLAPPTTVDSSKDSTGDDALLLDWSRGAAAMALARMKTPEALRSLVALAAHGKKQDPTGAELARHALQSVELPPHTEGLLAPLLTASDLKLALTEKPQRTLESLPTLSKTPSELVRDIEELLQSDPGEHRFHTLLSSNSETFNSSAAWQKAFNQDPVWSLRLLALFSLTRPKLKKWALKHALQSLSSDDANRKDAATWFVAVHFPAQTPQLDAADDVQRRAILRQATGGKLAQRALAWSRATETSESPVELSQLAANNALISPHSWKDFSTRQAWAKLGPQRSPGALSLLASRARPQEVRGSAPSFPEVQAWLQNGGPEERSSIALGLSHNDAPSSVVLLLQALELESDPQVRRALVSALYRRAPHSSKLQEVFALDPDAGCRARAIGGKDLESKGYLLRLGEPGSLRIEDRQGRILSAPAAPDGFVGVVWQDL